MRAAIAAGLLMLGGCQGGSTNSAAPPVANSVAPAGPNSFATNATAMPVATCLLEVPEGRYVGWCDRVALADGGYLIRKNDRQPFFANVTEAVVDVTERGRAATGSYRRGDEIVQAGALTVDAATGDWAGATMRIDAR